MPLSSVLQCVEEESHARFGVYLYVHGPGAATLDHGQTVRLGLLIVYWLCCLIVVDKPMKTLVWGRLLWNR